MTGTQKKKKKKKCVGVSGAITESTWSTDQEETVSIVKRTRGTRVCTNCLKFEMFADSKGT